MMVMVIGPGRQQCDCADKIKKLAAIINKPEIEPTISRGNRSTGKPAMAKKNPLAQFMRQSYHRQYAENRRAGQKGARRITLFQRVSLLILAAVGLFTVYVAFGGETTPLPPGLKIFQYLRVLQARELIDAQ